MSLLRRSRTESLDDSGAGASPSSSSLQHRRVLRCSLVNAVLRGEAELLPLVATMGQGGDPGMQRELDRAVARVVNGTQFKRDVGGSFSVALATFADQLLRGRSYDAGGGQEVVSLAAEQDRAALLPRVCRLAGAVKDKDVLRTHLEHAAMDR